MNDIKLILDKGKDEIDKYLTEEIKRLHDEEGIEKKLMAAQDDVFIKQHAYKHLQLAYDLSGFRDDGYKWHHVVREVLVDPEDRRYMYDRLLTLLMDRRGSYDAYFTLKTSEGEYNLPNPLADLNKLEILYRKYFKIYHNIKNRIHFGYPKKKHVGAIRGKINWPETIRMSTTDFPIKFVTSVPEKQFVTPENILLILCAVQLHNESRKLLEFDFTDPLSDEKKDILRGIIRNTNLILEGIDFPFVTLLNYSKQYWKLEFNDPKIKDLELKARSRIAQKIIRNQNYLKLLEWMDDFRELHILLKRVSAGTKENHILQSRKNLDTLYEAWIFLEFVQYLHEKNILINFQLDKHPNCTFDFNGTLVTFWYEKTFQVGENKADAWAVIHNPDYVAMIDDEILAIFDAKNYSKGGYLGDVQNKMLAYMNNLDTNFGALIFPNHPESWDEISPGRKENIVTALVNNKYPLTEKITRRWRQKKVLEQVKLSRDDEKFEFKQDFPSAYKTVQSKKFEDDKSYPKKTLAWLRMSPQNDRFSHEMKNTVLDFIFKSIIERIPVRPKVR